MYSVRQFILGPDQEFLAISRGIEGVDLTEIQNWAAGKGDLVSSAPVAHSWNFHPLPTGNFCLSRTSRLAILFPHENVQEVFTHGIIVPPGFLKDYANNAISLFRHLEKLGLWRAGLEVMRQLWNGHTAPPTAQRNAVRTDILPVLRTLTMDGGVEAVRLDSLNAFTRTTGIRRFCTILDQILLNFTTILTGNAPPDRLVEALLDVLPVGCRSEFSFSTGLRFSSSRLFRMVAIGNSVTEQHNIRRTYNLSMISSTSTSPTQDQRLPMLKNRWAMFVATLFEQKLEGVWNEIALLEETDLPSELPRRARFWFKKLGLDSIYQQIRENRKIREDIAHTGDESYRIYQSRTLDKRKAFDTISTLLPDEVNPLSEMSPSSETEAKKGKTPTVFLGKTGQEDDFKPKLREMVPPVAVQSYLATLSEAMHGNPLAENHLKNVFQEITLSVSEDTREETSELLLLEGIKSWNEEHNATQNRSWRQVEDMVDTLSTMLNLLEEN